MCAWAWKCSWVLLWKSVPERQALSIPQTRFGIQSGSQNSLREICSTSAFPSGPAGVESEFVPKFASVEVDGNRSVVKHGIDVFTSFSSAAESHGKLVSPRLVQLPELCE